jgi:hypothetical protein
LLSGRRRRRRQYSTTTGLVAGALAISSAPARLPCWPRPSHFSDKALPTFRCRAADSNKSPRQPPPTKQTTARSAFPAPARSFAYHRVVRQAYLLLVYIHIPAQTSFLAGSLSSRYSLTPSIPLIQTSPSCLSATRRWRAETPTRAADRSTSQDGFGLP